MPTAGTTWRQVLLVGACALLTLGGVDAALHRVAPPVHLLEVDEAMEQYADGDPTVLVLGSSHARAFVVMDEIARARTAGRTRIQPVPVEWGKYTPYAWVLEHRIRPILEARDPAGALVRPSLARVVIVTEWWDSTLMDNGAGGILMNLPARSWQWPDFAADVLRNNLTPYNTNFLQKIWRQVWWFSALVQDRGHEGIVRGLKLALKGRNGDAAQTEFEARIQAWQRMVEQGVPELCHPGQMAALEGIVGYFKGRGLDVTRLLYPRMPGTLSPTAKETTLRLFSERRRAFAASRGLRFVDMSFNAPLSDADFADDFDHILPEGNRRFAEWALDGELRFLLEPTTPPGRADDAGGAP